jgi:hypothetical protein
VKTHGSKHSFHVVFTRPGPPTPSPPHPNARPEHSKCACVRKEGGRARTRLLVDGVRLALVLGHVGVDELNDIRADGRSEHSWQSDGALGRLAVRHVEDRDLRARGRHLDERGKVQSKAATQPRGFTNSPPFLHDEPKKNHKMESLVSTPSLSCDGVHAASWWVAPLGARRGVGVEVGRAERA